MTARRSFEHELEALHEELTEMGSLVEMAIDKVIFAFKNQDVDLAHEIILGDRNVNDMERTIETRCLSLILRQQPVAKDLRSVTAALKVVTDMERIGDHAADISELLLRIRDAEAYHLVKMIPAMAAAAKEMVHDAVRAFVSCDLEAAKNTIEKDDTVDDLFNDVKSDVVELLRASTEKADSCIDVLMIAKYLERIGDHAVNICEWTEFHETGELNHFRIL